MTSACACWHIVSSLDEKSKYLISTLYLMSCREEKRYKRVPRIQPIRRSNPGYLKVPEDQLNTVPVIRSILSDELIMPMAEQICGQHQDPSRNRSTLLSLGPHFNSLLPNNNIRHQGVLHLAEPPLSRVPRIQRSTVLSGQ